MKTENLVLVLWNAGFFIIWGDWYFLAAALLVGYLAAVEDI